MERLLIVACLLMVAAPSIAQKKKEGRLLKPYFNCQLASYEDIMPCIDAPPDILSTKKANEFFQKFREIGKEQIGTANYDYLVKCPKVSTFVAYYDSNTRNRVIFYPEIYTTKIESGGWNWIMIGEFLHAVAHLQRDHTVNSIIRSELPADSLTAVRLWTLGATFEQALENILKKSPQATNQMPHAFCDGIYCTGQRFHTYNKVFSQAPTANFTYKCIPECKEGCKVQFIGQPKGIRNGTRYFLNEREINSLNVNFKEEQTKTGKYKMTFRVVNPNGEEDSITKVIEIK